ncbi:MAG: hypothetical protein ACYC61_12940 [Isosphaeraceae bacterium]
MKRWSRGLTLPRVLTTIVVAAVACAVLHPWLAGLVAAVAVVGCLLVSFRLAPTSDLFVLVVIAFVLGGLITAAERGRRNCGPATPAPAAAGTSRPSGRGR